MQHVEERYSPPLVLFGVSRSPEGEVTDAIDRADLPADVSRNASQKTRQHDEIPVPYQDKETRNINTSQESGPVSL
jgi:hypothetical protein